MTNTRPQSLLFKNFASLLFSNFFIQGIRFLTILVLARPLGDVGFGVYNYCLMLLAFGGIIVEFGLKNFGVREFSQGAGSWDLVRLIVRVRATVALIAVIIVTLLMYQAFRRTDLLYPTLFFSISLVIDAFLIDFVSISQERLHLQAVSQSLQALIFLAAAFLLNKTGGLTLSFLGLFFSLSHLVMILIYFGTTKIAAHSKDILAGIKSAASMKVVIVGGLPFLIANLLSTLQAQMDLFLLGQFHYVHLIGSYAACLKLLAVPTGVVGSFMGALQPRLARLSHDKNGLVLELKKYVGLVIGCGALVIMVCWFGAEQMASLFGPKFILVQFYLGPLSLVTAMFMLSLLPMHALMVSRDTKVLLKIVCSNSLLGAVVISTILYKQMPELLPWGMLSVQTVYVVQAWRHFLKK